MMNARRKETFSPARRETPGREFAAGDWAGAERGRIKLTSSRRSTRRWIDMPLWLVAFLSGVAFTVLVTSTAGGK
jgi:hypothetical protein